MPNDHRSSDESGLWSEADVLSPFAPPKPAVSGSASALEHDAPWVENSVADVSGESSQDFEEGANFEDEDRRTQDEYDAFEDVSFEERAPSEADAMEAFEDYEEVEEATDEDEALSGSEGEDFDNESFGASELDETSQFDALFELDPALEYDEPRERCRNVPKEVENCSDFPEKNRVLCAPGANLKCPAIPELWTSSTIDQVPFYYGARVKAVDGTGGKRVALVRATNKAYKVRLTPNAWTAAMRWIAAMRVFGMPITAVITAGAGPYCRCIKTPDACGDENPGACTGRSPSNHGAGDAIDVTGVVWQDHRSVGSSLRATLVHSWRDAEQARLLIRINAALRLSFATVIDYARKDHHDHFHVDTNNGRPRDVFGESTERWFLAGCLTSLGYLSSYGKPPAWTDVQPGLAAFARHAGVAVPTAGTPNAWRTVVTRLYGCIATGSPVHCRHR